MAELRKANVNPKKNPTAHRSAVQRMTNLALQAPDEIVEAGKIWYPRVREVSRRQSLEIGISSRHGAGIFAAVSPQLDFDNKNIHALGELSELRPSEWEMIRRDATSRDKRIPEVSFMLAERAPSLKQQTSENILKAGRILQGADPLEVIQRRSAPKTHAFFHNIDDPESDEFITIDGRQADLIANQLRPWTSFDRGISSADLKTPGRTTRYEDHETVMRKATAAIQKIDPRFRGVNAVGDQAITWLYGQQLERMMPGAKSNQGPRRQGQRYI